MGTINLSNSKGRDAVVGTMAVRRVKKVRYLDAQQRQAQSTQILKSTIDRDIEALQQIAGSPEKIAENLIHADPEIDTEAFGRFLKEASRVFINPEGKVVHKIKQFEVIRNPDGTERERRPRKIAQPNTAVETPLKWTGKLMKKSEVYNRFVFSSKQQIVHINGLTYDFLFGIAKELEEKQSLMLIGSGPKGTAPLIFMRGGQQYRGFLEGKTQSDKYLLVLHLSNMELKAPPKIAATSVDKSQAGSETQAKDQPNNVNQPASVASAPAPDATPAGSVDTSAPAAEAKPKTRTRKKKSEE